MAQERVDSLFASESWTAVYTAFTNVSLKAYDFDTIREALLKYVAETYPQKFNDFIASSEFIAILDLVAYLGHSLSFRNDMNTRENFMDTAERRESILRMAKTLGYNKTRPINARGFMKITSVRTNQAVFDSNGVSLSNRSIVWNDTNNVDWYENFVTVLNAAFTKESSVENPSNAMTNLNIENFLHVVNENSANSSVKFPFNANIGGKTRNFEAVRAEFDGNSIVESDPNIASKMTFVQRSDGLGPASDRTGFFVLAKAGSLKFRDFNFDTKLSNRIQKISDINISNSDVWVHKITTSGDFVSKVQKVDNDTRETAIYHTLKDRNADIVRVGSLEDNAIDLTFSDGVFGNAAYGSYRVWYRSVDNENFSVEQNDIKNVDISIPYIGSDNREYRLTVSMKSTTDFSENFEGENYLSVKRIAPRSYYAQDRMVNAQDYNVLPLTLGTNVVKKVKAVNTSHAGKSRYFEMDDVTGNHSNVHVNGTDGSLYFDNDDVKITLPFNKANGNINHFLKYELSTVLKHPAMINNFYNVTFNDPKYDFRGVLDAWERDATDLLKGTIVNTSTLPIEEGDSLLIVDTNEENGVWCKVVKVTTTGAFILDRIAPNGYVIQLVKSPRLKFNDAEIDTIKNYVVSENYTKPFYLWYDTYAWSVWYDGIENDIDDPSLDEDYAESLLKVKVEYKQGFRSLDSEFVCTIEGTKIVFDSRDDVKFFYNNEGPVVDQKTSLEKRDKIFINYYSDKVNVEGLNVISTPSQITLGQFDMNNTIYDTQTDVLDFDVVWCCSGAHQNFDFVNLHPEFSEVTYEHQLVNKNGCTAYTIPSPTDTVIGTKTDCTPYAFTVNDASTYLLDEEAIADDVTVSTTVEYEISNVEMSVTGGTGNTGNAAWATITVSSDDLSSLQGLNGVVSTSYLQDAVNRGKFFFFDESEIAPKTSQTIVSGDAGTVTPYLIEYDENTDLYTFTLPENQTIIGEDDADAYWKQIGLSEYAFTYVGPLTLPTDIAVKIGENFVNQSHYEIISLGNDEYKIIFWTAVPETSVISIFKVSGGSSFDNYDLRVIAKFNFISQVQVQTQKYEVAETFISEKFSTPMGYVDYSKVKLSPFTNDGNPYGMIEVIRDTKVDNNPEIILEKYTDENNVVYEKVSTNAVATATQNELLDMPNIWFDQTNEEWQRKTNGEWSVIIPNHIDGVRHVIIDNIEYRVVEGKSSVEDRYMSFRWDHYADENKRIDPSTSNVIDVYLLTSDYVNSVNSWIASGFVGSMPTPPNNYELTNLMSGLLPKASISDHVSFIPSKFKLLFGENASPENQATFKVVKRGGTNYTDSEIKTQVSQKINEYFNIDNWDFGESFYFSELAAYLHTELSDMISSVVMAPKYSSGDFKKLLSISSDPNEVLLGTTTSKDIKIIASISDSELAGE